MDNVTIRRADAIVLSHAVGVAISHECAALDQLRKIPHMTCGIGAAIRERERLLKNYDRLRRALSSPFTLTGAAVGQAHRTEEKRDAKLPGNRASESNFGISETDSSVDADVHE